MVRRHRTFRLELPRTNEALETDAVLMLLRREDVVGTSLVSERGSVAAERVDGAQAHTAAPAAILDVMAGRQAEVRAKASPLTTRPTKEEVESHNLTHLVFRNSCSCCVAM